MARVIPDLWPEIEQSEVVPPVAILREQAALLGEKTSHLLEGRVATSVAPQGRFVHSFYIVAPALGGYTYKLFDIEHGASPYPVEPARRESPSIFSTRHAKQQLRFETEAELLDYIRRVLNSDRTKRVLGNLLAQVKATA
jgi:hypothetical protein